MATITYTLNVLPSGRSVALHALADGAPTKFLSVDPTPPVVEINGTPATLSPARQRWSTADDHVIVFFEETVAPGDAVTFTDGGGGAGVVSGTILTYMDSQVGGWRNSYLTIELGSSAPAYGYFWDFTVVPGTYEFSITYPHWADAAQTASLKVYDNLVLVQTFTGINLRVPPSDDSENGATWEILGSVAIASTSLRVRMDGEHIVVLSRLVIDGVRIKSGSNTYYGDQIASAGSPAYEVVGGSIPALVDAPVSLSLLGGSIIGDTIPDITLGVVFGGLGTWYEPCQLLANWAKTLITSKTVATSDADGYPTANAFCQVSVPSNSSDPNGFAGAISGEYWIYWKGAGSMDLQERRANGDPGIGEFCTVTLISEDLTDVNNKWRRYNVVKSVNPSYALHLWTQITPPVTDWRIHPPGVAHDGSERWMPAVLEIAGRAKVLRSLGAAPKVNSSSIIDLDDFGQANDASYGWRGNRVRDIPITRIDGYSGNDIWSDTGWQQFEVTCASAHGLEPYKKVQFLFTDSQTTMPLTLAGGGGWDLYSARLAAFPTSATKFVVAMHRSTNVAVTTPFTGSNAVAHVDELEGAPIEYMLDLCTRVGADFWFSAPFLMDDATVSAVVAEILAETVPGQIVYWEMANEFWNQLQDFSQHWEAASRAKREGLITGADGVQTQFVRGMVDRAVEVFAIVRAAFALAGRSSDLKFVIGTQFALVNLTEEIAAYCAARGLTDVAYIAGAPYIQVNETSDASFDSDGLDVGQVLDILEVSVQGDAPYLISQSQAHVAAFVAEGFTDIKFACYETAIQGLHPPESSVAIAKRQSNAAFFHSRFGGIYKLYWKALADGGCEVANHFSYMFSLGSFNFDGVVYQAVPWMLTAGTYMTYGKGDGSDGKFDNDAALAGLPIPAVPWDQAVSVVAQAMGEVNAPATDAPNPDVATWFNRVSRTNRARYRKYRGAIRRLMGRVR